MISIIAIMVLLLAETVRMETCEETKIIDFMTKEPVDIQKDCGNGTKPCMLKCCDENEVLFKIPLKNFGTCRNLNDMYEEYTRTAIQDLLDYSNVEIDTGTIMSFFEDFRLLYSDKFVTKACSKGPAEAYLNEKFTVYWFPYEESPDIISQATMPDFCMDKIFGFTSNGSIGASYAFYYRSYEQSVIQTNTFLAYGGAVSAFFMLLVFVIHCLLKFLHGNLKGKLLMGFLFNMMVYFMYNALYSFILVDDINNMTENTSLVCGWASYLGYFTFVSAFFWMHAMCYDIYRKFSTLKLKSLESDDKRKMWIYSTYAIGVPALCTIISVLIDKYASDRVRPGFETCMQDDDNYPWKRLYLRLPTGLVILSNVVMWVLTVCNMRRMRVEIARTARKESTHTRKGDVLSNVYGKLFILMGVNWLIELFVISVKNMEDWVFYLTNAPNTLLGVWIFLATVCNKKIFIKLCRRFGTENKSTNNTNTTQVSQVTSASRAKASNRNKNTD